MAKLWKVVYTRSARRDLFNINDYIRYNLQSPQSANNITNKLSRTIESLNYMPLKYARYPKEPWHSLGLRFVPVAHYIIFYHPEEEKEEVQIIRIMYSGEDVFKHLPNSLKID
ncbi:type II toxin-antitoxin system RelE/ParE family toxin [Liquorilactobacillus vini]|uniref:type II toxin-antitoxin system RelE/ParE family toxin n=1 Tax=Liquorilactobacillus vini TaxID=238015 RepID=UPI00054F21EF|nr:type II toxin-antitoxin system RelE/ParE family toxin [Liquorilactobacillus vini]